MSHLVCKMIACLYSLMTIEMILLAASCRNWHIVPDEGSVAGGTWITIVFDGLEQSFLYPTSGSQLEISLVNVDLPWLPHVPCDVSPVYEDVALLRCQTRSLQWETQEGLYYLEVRSGGQLFSSMSKGSWDNCTFKFSKAQTPIVYQVNPPSGVPGNLIQVHGWIITGRTETFDNDVEYIDSPLTLQAQGGEWITPCSLVDREKGNRYPVEEDHGIGVLQCRVEGHYIGSQNVSFSVFNKGKSTVHKDAWLISAKQELFLYQTYSEIWSVFPVSGSLGGGTDITITGDFFDYSAQVTIAGIPCRIKYISPRKIECTTRPLKQDTKLTSPHPGNRGLLFEVGDAQEDLDLTNTTPGYRWQIVPNASSPFGFWSEEGQHFRARLSGFFVAPETNNYTFWIQADSPASLYFSQSADPENKMKVAFIQAGATDWFNSWERNGHLEAWQQKSQKLELLGGAKYYLEANHYGVTPSHGMSIGVQIHNTWLNPDVVNSYHREKLQIRARAQRIPEIQILNVTGTGTFCLTWDGVSSQPVTTNATAAEIQAAIEELLTVKCKLEPLSAKILLWFGFEEGLEDSGPDGDLTSGTEPFCGRFSIHQPQFLVRTSEATQMRYQLDQYTHLCFAYKGHMNDTMTLSVSFTNKFHKPVKKKIVCEWNPEQLTPESWKFVCNELWETCVRHSGGLYTRLANSPVLVHRIDMSPLEHEKSHFYIDEIIVADRNLTVSQVHSRIARPGGKLIESLSVTGAPSTYNITLWMAGCGCELPLIQPCYLPPEEANESSRRVSVTVQRLQRMSPALEGHFQIQLPNTVISGIPVHISAHDLLELLQNSGDDFASQFLNVSDFKVQKDLSSCYEHVWTLMWMSQIGDLPNIIRVSAENLTGIIPTVSTRVVYDGGIFLGPIFGDMLVTPNTYPQVTMRVNDIPAHCSGSCSFQYLQESTPLVQAVWYSYDDDINLLVCIMGSGFPGDSGALKIKVNQQICEITFSNQTYVTCKMGFLPIGKYQVVMLVRHLGFALNVTGGEGIHFNIEPKLKIMEPSVAPEIGGLWTTIQGTNLEHVSLVLFGSQPCPVNITTRKIERIQCKVPPWIDFQGNSSRILVNVTIITRNVSVSYPEAFKYSPSLNPVILSLSRIRSNTAGDQTLFIGTTSLANYTDLNVEVHIQDTLATILKQVPQGLEVALPSLPAGWHNISVTMNGVNIIAEGVDLQIQYITEVFKIEPCCGSLLGGTTLTISGIGFSKDPSLVTVSVGNQTCNIVNSTEETIWCETSAAPHLPGTESQAVMVPIEVLVGNIRAHHGPSFGLGKDFTFIYHTALTPFVTAMQGQIRGDMLEFQVEGNNLSESVVLLGHMKCDLELQFFSFNRTQYFCSLPLANMEAGIYPIQVFRKDIGFANISAVPHSFTVAPQITDIFPTHGSVCGGTWLTVIGLAFKSRMRLVQIDLSDHHTCAIWKWNDQMILCQVSFVGHLPKASLAMNVTITANGISSECQGNCTFYLQEESTPIVEKLTTSVSGTLTTMLIGGQKLATATDELVVLVDDHLSCDITFYNATWVECQLSDLGPGLHHFSLLNGRSGFACLGTLAPHFSVVPQVLGYHPQNFSINGGGLLTIEGTTLRGKNTTSVLIGHQPCFTVNISSVLIQCIVPPGNGTVDLEIEVDGNLIDVGIISYSEVFTPALLFILQIDGLIVTFMVARTSGAKNMQIFIGASPCVGILGNYTVLQCSVAQLPTGEYQVKGFDRFRGWASSTLVFTSNVTITSIHRNFGCLSGSLLHVHGSGFSPGNMSAEVCGVPCQVLDNATVTNFSCLVLPLDASLAFLCNLRPLEESCKATKTTYIQCELTVTVGTINLLRSWSYIYMCEENPWCSLVLDHQVDSSLGLFSGLFISPKVERDEVLIYNSSCNITMETEAEMECEAPNQPITAKITEIRKNWGQNTQDYFQLQVCRRWSRAHSWIPQGWPQDGDNVTVESGQTLLLDITTSVLSMLHIKGGKLIFTGPGPIELHAHCILVSHGGELQIGSLDEPYHGKALIYLHGSSSTTFYPYGAKFLAVRNGTLSLHGLRPEVSITHLRTAAQANDTMLALEDHVDWHPGEEVIISGVTLEGSQRQEEIAIIESTHGANLHLQSPLRYSHGILEHNIGGHHIALRVTVALLSRNIAIQGHLTNEGMAHLQLCTEAKIPEDDFQQCLYLRSEKNLGSMNLGAVVIVQSLPGEPSQVQLQGVQFQYMGQAFQKHLCALNVIGPIRDSYIRSCSVWDSFSRGLSLSRTSNLIVENNVFYNILGHGLLVGTHMEMKHFPWKAVPRRKTDWSRQGNIVRSNVVIGVFGTEGLSNIEVLSPAGIYIQDPISVVERNMVCAAGYGYFFHLGTSETSKAPLRSFTQNVAHSCTRYGLLVYPRFEPPQVNDTGPTLFQNFTAWGSQGGVQIFRSSNLQLKNFQIYSCKDFGIDILESDANSSIVESLLLSHYSSKKGSSCMSAGIKTPKRQELLVSKTTFVNFDQKNCISLRTCSSCYRGQGGFTVKTEQLKFLNSPNRIAFPFPHAAILEDLDGSVSGNKGRYLLASVENLASSCQVNQSFGQTVKGSVCGPDVIFHRMSIGLAEAPDVAYDLTVTDSKNQTMTINFVNDTLSNLYGWMALLLDQDTYLLRFEASWIKSSLQYSATFDNFTSGNYLLVVHKDLQPYADILVICGTRIGQSLLSSPSATRDQACDWFFNSHLGELTYLVSGEGQVHLTLLVKERIIPATPVPSDVPKSILKWSHPGTWQGVEEGWGGYNHTTPAPGDDVVILPNKTILVDTDLPFLKGLYVLGTLEFPVNRSNVLNVACIIVAGGELKVGTFPEPLHKGQKLLIQLRASEGDYCDRLDGINIAPGTFGVYGKVQLHSAYPRKAWTHLGADIASGNERILVKDEVDWRPQDKIVLSSSSYEPHEAEILTIKEVMGQNVRLYEHLNHRHLGSSHSMEDGRHISLAAEVGLLTRNIKIQPDAPCGGRMVVGSFQKPNGEEFSGTLQLSNVEIQNFGSLLYPSIEFNNVSLGSWMISSSVHQSCGGGIRVSSSKSIFLHDNILFDTTGHGIDLEGQNHSLIKNLIVLTKQPQRAMDWVTGIKVNQVNDANLIGNAVAGSERIGFHIKGHDCSMAENPWVGNVVHSSLHGLHVYKGDGLYNCTKISGFLSYKNFDYGAMFHVENNLEINNMTLVDNVVGLLPLVYASFPEQCSLEKKQIVLRNSIIVATSSSFDCIEDRIKPLSADFTSRDRPPSNPRGGRVGILWPGFTAEPNQWPQDAWHKVKNYPSVSGIMRLEGVTFSDFVKSCYSNDLDVCILPNPDSPGIIPPIMAERTKMLKVKDQNKFYFSLPWLRKETGKIVCPELDCESPMKYLFKDLDGSVLDLPPPISVFPKSKSEWVGSCFNTGIFREDRKCTYRPSMQSFVCKQMDYILLILDNITIAPGKKIPSSVVSVTSGFVETFSSIVAHSSCSASLSIPAFYSLLPTNSLTKICFVNGVPQAMRFYLIGSERSSKVLAVFYPELQSPRVFFRGQFIPPTSVLSDSWQENGATGTNHFSFMDNLLYILLQGDEPVEVQSAISIYVAFTVTLSSALEDWEPAIDQRLAHFLQIGQDHIRIVHILPGGERILKAFADGVAKRKHHCPSGTPCTNCHRLGQHRNFMRKMKMWVPPSTFSETISKVVVIEIGDLSGIGNAKVASSLSTDGLQCLVHRIITSQQTGELQEALNMPVEALLISQSAGVFTSGNSSSLDTGSVVYIQPFTLSVQVQPSSGEVGIELPVQPHLVFLDKQGRVVESLGPPSEPWIVTVSLEGASETVLKGHTHAEAHQGRVSFSNLAVSSSGSNWYFLFTVTSPPGAKFNVRSEPFAVLPVNKGEKSTILMALVLCSAASWMALCFLVFCWLKKSKKTKTKETSGPQVADRKKNPQVKHNSHPTRNQERLEETKKGTTVIQEDMRQKAIQGKPNQSSYQQSLNGLTRRMIRTGHREGGRGEVPTEVIAHLPSQGHDDLSSGTPAQQVPIQEVRDWKDGQAHLLGYHPTEQDQLLVLYPSFDQEGQKLPEQRHADRKSDHLGYYWDRKAKSESFHLHSLQQAPLQGQL
ncbi:fibrocystin isoform X1 [Monodelphis domestica]|uniref:fibrocystin isoform X1 n=1 Tax=Monodelphis domestica TaxID=13616 RepID=UPI0024E2137C|nr:fibrocystin isoform X1 [Monodelphis domestica]